MDKLSIRKLFERAKANDTIAQEELYEYYYERYHSFVILDKRIPNMEEIYIESIKNAVSRSISNPDSTLDSTQKLVKSTFINKIKSYNRKSVKWGEQKVLPKLIEEASNGSKEARNKLIERYMYIVDKRIENIKFNDHYIEEDIRQAGYLFLTEKINNYFDAGLKVPLSVYLLVAFDQIYLNFLREKKEEVEEYHDKVTLAGLYLNKDTFEEENIEFEYCDFIDSTLEKDDIKEIFKSLTDSKEIRISKEQGISRQAVNKKIHKNKQKVKSFFDMK